VQQGSSAATGRPSTLLARIVAFPLTRLLLALAIVIGTSALFTIGLYAWLRQRAEPTDPASGLRSLILVLVLIALTWAAYAGYVRLIERRPVTELGLKGAPLELGLGALIGIGLLTLTIALVWLLGGYDLGDGSPWPVLLPALALALSSGFTEEVLLRGIIFRIVEEVIGTWLALLLTALLFGFLHLGNPGATAVSALAITLEAGVLLGAAYVLTRRLWLAIGLHAGWNFAQGGLFGVPVSGNPVAGLLSARPVGPDELTGGAFGVEASIVAVFICLPAGLVLLALAWRRGQLRPPAWRRPRLETPPSPTS
jgi:hypothetical protein